MERFYRLIYRCAYPVFDGFSESIRVYFNENNFTDLKCDGMEITDILKKLNI